MHRFEGKLTLPDGRTVPVEMSLDELKLSLSTEGAQVGTWPIKYCRVAVSGDGRFQVSLDGELAEFVPDESELFGLVAARTFHASKLADRIDVVRSIPNGGRGANASRSQSGDTADQPPGTKPLPPFLSFRSLAGFLVVLAAALVWYSARTDSDPPAPDPVPETSTTIAPAAPPLFDQTPDRFVEEWNRVASEFDAPVRILGRLDSGYFEAALTPRLTLQGTTDSDGTLASLVLAADPTGQPTEDKTIIAGWGVAIAMADPTLNGPGRRDILVRLGLDVDDPQLAGLNGEVESGDTRYTMLYVPEFATVLFTVSPS